MIRAEYLGNIQRRTAWSSFFIFCAALLLLAASLLLGNSYLWGAIALLGLACIPVRSFPVNSLGILLVGLGVWFLVYAFVTPAYASLGIYRPLIWLGTFAAVAGLGRESLNKLFRIAVLLAAVLVLIGLLQYFFGFWHLDRNSRPAATFVTPNTFATAINLFLLPVTALFLAGKNSRENYVACLWLFAGLVATGSRGGLLGFLAGLIFIAGCIGPQALWQARRSVSRLLIGGAFVWVAIRFGPGLLEVLMREMLDWQAAVVELSNPSSALERLEIYKTTWTILLERPFAGWGANMFSPLFESVKGEAFRNKVFPFVHNDYLQIWLEFGAVGLLLLVGVAGTSIISAWRATRLHEDPLPLVCGAALTSCFAHAVVDFPLFVPFTLMVTVAYLGALAAHAGNIQRMVVMKAFSRVGTILTYRVRLGLILLLLAWASQPMIAEFAGDAALNFLRGGEVDRAIYWQSVARRLEPMNAAHYWAEGVIWRDQAVEARDKAFVAKADSLFAGGIRANAYDVNCYLERARLHRQHADFLDSPATPDQILAWTSEALRLRPYSVATQAEQARALANAGQSDKARTIVNAMLARDNERELGRRLARELKMPDAAPEGR